MKRELSYSESQQPRVRTLKRMPGVSHASVLQSRAGVRRVRVLRRQQNTMRRWKIAKLAGVSIAVMALLMPLVNYVGVGEAAPVPIPPGTIDPMTIPKFVNQLAGSPPVYKPVNVHVDNDPSKPLMRQEYTVYMEDDIDGQPILQQILPTKTVAGLPTGFLPTKIWGYRGAVYPSGDLSVSAPGATFEATRGVPVHVTWVNNIDNPNMFPVDPTLHWANPTEIPMEEAMNHAMMGMSPMYPPGYDGIADPMTNPMGWDAQSIVPAVPHLHGGEVSSWYDGGPEAWFTSDGKKGPTYDLPDKPEDYFVGDNGVLYKYPNEQPATTLWYHDHALGITRTNVMSGLAGFYLLRDQDDPNLGFLPSGKYEVPLAIQDRTFKSDGSFYFDTVGINPEHPYWTPEFFGNTVMVNGLVWPNMDVDQGVYRFRLLDGSNARFYSLSFWDKVSGTKLPFVQIGSDGGYLKSPAAMKQLTIAPGERADILVDFRGLPVGTKILLSNFAKAPFPNGAAADPRTVGQIMQFTVTANIQTTPPVPLPATQILNPDLAGAFPSLPAATSKRTLVLNEVMGAGGPLELLLNGLKWDAPVSENPVAGTTEEWVIVNPTADTHPIHLHLVQFQLVSRQSIDAQKYLADWLVLNGVTMLPFPDGHVVKELDTAPYLKNKPRLAPPNEQGWKDTVQMNPGEVTIIRVKFAPIDGTEQYPFIPTEGPGYVWHCHIIDHEDNEMMRPYEVKAA